MLSCSAMSSSSQPHGLEPARLLCPRNSPDKHTWVESYPLLQGLWRSWFSLGNTLERTNFKQFYFFFWLFRYISSHNSFSKSVLPYDFPYHFQKPTYIYIYILNKVNKNSQISIRSSWDIRSEFLKNNDAHICKLEQCPFIPNHDLKYFFFTWKSELITLVFLKI